MIKQGYLRQFVKDDNRKRYQKYRREDYRRDRREDRRD